MPHVAARTASRDRDPGRYQSHRPEQTLLYQIVDEYYPAFAALMAEQGKELPGYVQREFEEFLQCGRLEHGFLRVRCESCHAEHLVAFSCKRRGFCPSCGARRMAESAALLVDEVLPEQPMRQWVLSFPFQLRFLFASRPEIMGRVLGIVYRVIATHLVKKAGHTHQVAKTGAVTLIQRFGSALNLNVHFHMLFLDGVYVEQSHGSARFRWVKAPTSPELTQLTHTIAHRVGRYLERQGLLERDVENSYLASDAVDDDPMTPLLGHSITYRIAVGSQAGRKVFTLQTLPTSGDPFGDGIGKVAGSSLHAGVAARADERKKLEADFTELSDRALLAGMLPVVTDEIQRLKTIRFLTECAGDTATNTITKMGNDIADTVITPRLRDRFQEEIVRLAASKVRVEIVRSGGKYGSPQYQVRLFANPKAKVHMVRT